MGDALSDEEIREIDDEAASFAADHFGAPYFDDLAESVARCAYFHGAVEERKRRKRVPWWAWWAS